LHKNTVLQELAVISEIFSPLRSDCANMDKQVTPKSQTAGSPSQP